jgi:hypothetical protein
MLCVKRSGTTCGRVEVHVLSGANDFGSFVLQTPTALALADAPNFQFAVGDYNSDTKPDLYCFKVTNTDSGRMEVHILSGASNYHQFLLHIATRILATDAAAHFSFHTVLDPVYQTTHVLGVKRSATDSGRAEVHILSGTTNYQQFLLQTATALDIADAPHFNFVTADFFDSDGGGNTDLLCFKTNNTGTGHLEIHVLSGW